MDIDFSTWLLIGIIVAVMALRSLGAWQRSQRVPLYCPRCGTVAKSKHATRGSGTIEILLWLCFIIPGLIYTLWRASSKFETCPACGDPGIIPASSPKAQAELKTRGVS